MSEDDDLDRWLADMFEETVEEASKHLDLDARLAIIKEAAAVEPEMSFEEFQRRYGRES